MEVYAPLILLSLSMLALLVFAGFALYSLAEGEQRAAIVSLEIAIFSALLPGFLVLYLPSRWQPIAVIVALGSGGLLLLFLLLPIGRPRCLPDEPTTRFDERQIMFARARLEPGSPEFQSYYAAHPEHLNPDGQTRSLPGLLAQRAKLANPWAFVSAEASFRLTNTLRHEVERPPGARRDLRPASEMSSYLKHAGSYFGARTIGITRLQPAHIYSHTGRGSGVYGAPIELDHGYAIVFTVEMDFELLACAPNAPVVMESARQYVESARIALQLSYLIQGLGYRARAHIDGNYQVIAPLLARDAGLGEIGRLSLLITPELGPRVRLGVVTTNLPLEADARLDGSPILDFCRICRKCADNCPSRSIPFDERLEIDGAFRWKLNPDTCFRYWNAIGTDCGICLRVCPYSHPDSSLHNQARWLGAHSGGGRRLLRWADDLFYGRQPQPRPSPTWLPPG